ncbi:hypothetical protein GCM10010912_58080 [Paenibacillus albidus]|uniref:SLH domain-containing protein n=1 Tax=Paenibacillus albidus TaxID=2041023 RepID=A0A917D1U1_9BACL|nr:serine hydrolase [Paenibacillus albidus]GGG05796.1 hypothetical protein GCM10010912_58080 [Paenibacillus albidus]
MKSTGNTAELTSTNAQAFMNEFFERGEIKEQYAGAAVVIVKEGQIILEQGYGYANKEKQQKVDPNSTVFRVASVSKLFTAIALMKLVEQGKVGLQDDISKYLGDLKQDNPYPNPVTIEQLLTHTTGFEVREVRPEDTHTDYETRVDLADYVRLTLPPVVREPGTTYMYDNFASMLQGYIVEKISCIPFQTYVEQTIFQPLGMNNSSFEFQGKLREALATGYGLDGNPVPDYAYYPTVMPQGGMLSTAGDFGKFMLAFLNGGHTGSGHFLSDHTIREMMQYRSYIHPLLPDSAYGFEAPPQLPGAGASSHIFVKEGGMDGYGAYIWFIPEQNTAVFVVHNQMGRIRDTFYPAFMNHFFPQYGEAATIDSDNAKKEDIGYSGIYTDPRVRSFVTIISPAGNGDFWLEHTMLPKQKLKQTANGIYTDEQGNFAVFKEGKNGKVYLKYYGLTDHYMIRTQGRGFIDVAADHPYAEYIRGLQSVDFYENDAVLSFQPERLVTRGEFIRDFFALFGIPGSNNPVMFQDAVNHPHGKYIQLAAEAGIVLGDGKGMYHPDRPITRQEAALIVWGHVSSPQYPESLHTEVKLSGNTDELAIPAVKLMAAIGYYGPQAKFLADGSIDFQSQEPLSHQEEAAILYKILLTRLLPDGSIDFESQFGQTSPAS